MRRAIVLLGLFLLVGLAMFFSPAPLTQTVHADRSSACPGLNRALQVCFANNPNPANCTRIFEQLLAHGCTGS